MAAAVQCGLCGLISCSIFSQAAPCKFATSVVATRDVVSISDKRGFDQLDDLRSHHFGDYRIVSAQAGKAVKGCPADKLCSVTFGPLTS